MSEKNYTIESQEGYKLIKLAQNLDYFNCKALENEISSIVTKTEHVIVSLEGVTTIPKDWIRTLLLIHLGTKKSGKEMRLINVGTYAHNCLRMEGTDSTFRIAKTLKDALYEFGIGPKKKMDMEFLNPFLTAAIRVLEVQANTKGIPGKTYLKKGSENLAGDVSGIIGIVSENFTGSVVMSFPEATFLKIMSRMLDETITELSREVCDGAGEITNMIFGQAKVELNQKGYGIKTALPSVISGKDHSLYSTTKGPIIVIPFTSDAGDFFVEISLSD